MYRRTTPGVTSGTVSKKHRTAVSRSYYNTPHDLPVFDRRKPGKGHHHILSKAQIVDFISMIPDWDELSPGLNAIVLTAGGTMQGYFKHRKVWVQNEGDWSIEVVGVIHLAAVARNFELELSPQVFVDYCCGWILERMRVPYRKMGKDSLLFSFTEDSMRCYQLLDVFIHELGHHRDLMTSRHKNSCAGGEPYAVAYARKYGSLIWDRYVDVFGDPTHGK